MTVSGGVVLGKRPAGQSRRGFSVPGKAQFSPLQISGLAAWYDFSDATALFTDVGLTTPVSADGNFIKGVADKSAGGANDLTDATGVHYKVNIQNGRSVGRFDTARRFQSAAFGAAMAQPNTVLAVVNYGAALDAFEVYMDGLGGGHQHQVYLEAGPLYALYAGATASAAVGPSTNTWYIQAAIFNGAASNLWVNGTQVITNGNPGSNDFDGISLGGNFTPTVLWVGDIAEFILYDGALSAGDRGSVQNYLAAKWGITVA